MVAYCLPSLNSHCKFSAEQTQPLGKSLIHYFVASLKVVYPGN